MRNTRKLLVLPVVAVTSATVLLFASLGLSAASVPFLNESEPVKVAADNGTTLSIATWNETAGGNTKGIPGGGGGTISCGIKR